MPLTHTWNKTALFHLMYRCTYNLNGLFCYHLCSAVRYSLVDVKFMDHRIILMLWLLFCRIRITANPTPVSDDLFVILWDVMHNSLFKHCDISDDKTMAVSKPNAACVTVKVWNCFTLRP